MVQTLRILSSLLVLGNFAQTSAVGSTRLCNGHAELCSRKYSNVTFVGAHDSAFVGDLPSQNQILSLKDQLDGGIRFLQSQVHVWKAGETFEDLTGGLLEYLPDVLVMCHTSCALAFGGFLHSYLGTVKDFLHDNPEEVVTLLLTNPDNAPMNAFNDVFRAVDLDSMAYTPSGPSATTFDQWPTLSEMIEANQRIVVFIDYGADGSVPYLLDEFDHFWETPFNTLEPHFPQCAIDRKNKLDETGRASMNIVNHFLDIQIPCTDIVIPHRCFANSTNAVEGEGSICAQAELCNELHGRNPNVILIDFFGKGDAMGAQKRLNGL